MIKRKFQQHHRPCNLVIGYQATAGVHSREKANFLHASNSVACYATNIKIITPHNADYLGSFVLFTKTKKR